MSRKMPDREVYDRLHSALLAMGDADGATVHGDTAIKAARRAVTMLQVGVLTVMDKSKDQEPPSDAPRSD